ncbi:hypothetical protein MW290_17975 [Aquincola tertiaricarbonis]|mgnify:CR=1 FL=1|uniref:Uncharacterized protein n=1 Tax=Aquincola tertiaricarbonis TaxID=391953 RepID=A0ABY4SE74_AQUTE|nr:hypothetical protein [Aquincola tertiaricarbonis]URI10870.1 hypothetical protein MW290_17975 [Aquincola tertiaricarbonis]
MLNPSTTAGPSSKSQELEVALAAVELHLSSLGQALQDSNTAAIEKQATELHRSLATAVNRFAQAARQGGVPPALRQRLATASGRVAAQRESLARATAALDRAIDALMPGQGTALYGASGVADRGASSGVVQA